MKKLKSKEIAIHTFIKNDKEDNDLPHNHYKTMHDLAEKLNLSDDLYVFETAQGFVVKGKPALRSQRFIQLNTKQLKYIAAAKGLRFVRIDQDTINFHFSH